MYIVNDEYSSHREQLEAARHPELRVQQLKDAVYDAFGSHIEERPTSYVVFEEVTLDELSSAFFKHPVIIKSVLALVNVAQRAVERDLGISLNTYAESISPEKAAAIAGYIKPLLPREAAVPSIIELDRYFWTDKQMRARKGRWEKSVVDALSLSSKLVFKKRKFEYNGEQFELDGAYPESTEDIQIGIDVKRVEAPRDVHKRGDEIVNKASKFKSKYPNSLFFAVVYYPFPSQHSNLMSRVDSKNIDGVYFAGESKQSIDTAMKLLAGELRDTRKSDLFD